MDPIQLRLVNEPDREPDSGKPFSSRHLTECLRDGARRFGWTGRDPRPRSHAEGPLLVGTGVAAATYPVLVAPSTAEARALPDGTFVVRINATDIGTGARTVLTQVAADALGTPLDRVRTEVGDSDLPPRRWPAAPPEPPPGAGPSTRRAPGWREPSPLARVRCPTRGSPSTRTPRARPTPTAPTRATPSARTSRRPPWTASPARSGCAGC
ncbi:hypothetical protein SHIRM173S_11442 [Streptomyces hirsutus]